MSDETQEVENEKQKTFVNLFLTVRKTLLRQHTLNQLLEDRSDASQCFPRTKNICIEMSAI